MFDLVPCPDEPGPALPVPPAGRATRLLAVSGGGLLGIVAAAFLERLEILGREAHGRDYRLAHSFDLVGGTSTGAVLATAVALGLPAERMVSFYMHDTKEGFRRRRLALPGLGALFDATALERHIARVTLGRRLERSALAADLAVVVKNLETSTPMILTSVPDPVRAADACLGTTVHHAPIGLDTLLRAATAAPGIFTPQMLPIGLDGAPAICIDGGLSPFNDPALLLHHYVRSGGLGAGTAARPIELTAVGTASAFRARHRPARLLRLSMGQVAFAALRTMIQDGMWLADAELRRLAAASTPVLEYRRHDMALTEKTFELMGVAVDPADLRRIRDPFDLRGKARLYEVAALYAERMVTAPLPLRHPRADGVQHAAA